MKLSPETRARERPQRYPMAGFQSGQAYQSAAKATNPVTVAYECKRCQQPCGYCDQLDVFRDE